MIYSKKILFIGQDYTQANEGLSVVTKRNLRLLQKCGYDIDQILIKDPSIWIKLKNLMFHESYGYNHTIAKQIKASLQKDFDFVFFDRSIFGPIVKVFSNRKFKTICFFHNVEAHLSKRRLKVTRNPLYWLFYHNLCRNELITTQYANIIIAISERDQQELKEVYRLSNVYLMPTSFVPKPSELLHSKNEDIKPYCLFVGSDFFANQEGIIWFVKKVAPYISCDLKVVGSICNSLKNMQLPSNVGLEGYVENLDEYYINAMCVISPIFSGSGLKTKTIEALRFGKVIFGTDEAFVGIKPELYDEIGKLCNSSEEFINAINSYSRDPIKINEGSLNVFNKFFSDEVAFSTFKSIISR